MTRNTKRKLKKVAILTLPAAAVLSGLIVGTCLSTGRIRELKNERDQYQANLINKYTSTEEFKKAVEEYENALKISLDNKIITQKQYDTMLWSRTCEKQVLNEISLDSDYLQEYKILQDKNYELSKSSIPFVLFSSATILAPIAYPIALNMATQLKKQKDEDSPYGNEYRYTTDNGLEKE